MKPAVLFLLLLISGSASGQYYQHYVISGTVLTVDSLPAENVLLETEIGPVVTDRAGHFHLELSQLPTAVVAKYRGYPTNDFYIGAPPPGRDSVSVVLVLEPNVHDMDEFVVTNERVQWVYQKNDLHIIDCVILPEGFALCGVEDHKYWFRVIDDNGSTTAEMPIREHPQKLFRDCEGELHICYYDSVYQVRWANGRAAIYNTVTAGYFNSAIETCTAKFDSVQVIAYQGKAGWDWGVVFYFAEHRLARLHKLYQATSRKYLIRVEEYKTYMARGGKSRKDRTDNDQLDLQKQELVAHANQVIDERNSPKKPPVALNVRDSLEVFDFMNDSVVVYTSDMRLVRRFPISLHVNRHFHGQVLTDLSGQRVFFVFTYDGMARVLEVEPVDGRVIGETKLTNHIYPSHLQIRGDFVYYLYQNHIDRAITFLFRQRLNDPRK